MSAANLLVFGTSLSLAALRERVQEKSRQLSEKVQPCIKIRFERPSKMDKALWMDLALKS
jgi:hypothetical protein